MLRRMLIVLAYIERAGCVLLTRRPTGVHQAGRWEFPGGKVEAGESLSDALQRELYEEIGVSAAVNEQLAVTRYQYPDRQVELHLLRCTILTGEPTPRQVAELCWVRAEQLAEYDFPPANAALLAALPVSGREKGGPSCPKE